MKKAIKKQTTQTEATVDEMLAKISKRTKALKAKARKAAKVTNAKNETEKSRVQINPVKILLSDGTTFNLNAKELGGYIVGTYDWGTGDGNIDLTHAETSQELTEVGYLFIRALYENICYRK